MKTQKITGILFALLISLNLSAQEEDKGFKFKDITDIKVTSVKSQQKTGTCWSFSTTSFIEAELFRTTDNIYDLSEMYFVRHTYEEKGLDYARYHGKINFGEGGQAHDVMNVIDGHGLVTQQAYPGNEYDPGNYRHRELDKILKAVLDVIITKPNKSLTTVWFEAYQAILDTYLGNVPENFEADGKILTPYQFVEHVNFNTNDYVELTSFTHHPYYEKIILEVPDNWSNDPYYNLPLNEFMEVMNYSLQNGYTFVWDGDVGFEGFSHKNETAIVPVGETDFSAPTEEKVIDPQYRQKQFDNLTTTDDHLMHIVGLAQDQNGTMYYKTKNSWGDDSNDIGGFLYMSESYMKLNTIAVMVHKNAIPKSIKDKLGIE